MKRPKMTAEQFHEKDNRCEVCGNRRFLITKQGPTLQPHYRMWGYQTRRIQWRIQCATKNCGEPLGVILKPTEWDSVDS